MRRSRTHQLSRRHRCRAALLAGWRMPAGHAGAATALSVSVGGSRKVDLSRTGTVFDVGTSPTRAHAHADDRAA